MSFVYRPSAKPDFDRFGHTGKFFGTSSNFTGHLIIETEVGYEKAVRERECEFNYFVLSGSGEFVINGTTYPCAAGDLVVIPPGNIFTVNGKLKMLLINAPKFTPEQDEELPKSAAYDKPS